MLASSLLACTTACNRTPGQEEGASTSDSGDTADEPNPSSGTWYGSLDVVTAEGEPVCGGYGYVAIADSGMINGDSSCIVLDAPGVETWGVLYDGWIDGDGGLTVTVTIDTGDADSGAFEAAGEGTADALSWAFTMTREGVEASGNVQMIPR